MHLPVAGDDRLAVVGAAISLGSFVAERVEAGEVALLDELERRAATGADVVDPVGEAELRGSPPRCRRRRPR